MNRHNILAGFMLGLVGFAVNWFKLELFFNVDFLFGSIVTMFALLRYGLAAGTIAALVAATCTWHHWHQPWAIIIFTAEAFFAGLLVKKRRYELVTADILFWFSAGLLLVWISYNQVMEFSFQSTLLIALKQGVNGIFNALVAMGFSIVFAYRDSRTRELPSLYQILFVSLALFVLIPAMGYLHADIQRSLDRQLKNYRESTARTCDVSEHSASLWLALNRNTHRGAAIESADFSELRHLLQHIVGARAVAITLVDQKGRVVVSTRDELKQQDSFDLPRNGSVTPVGDGVGHWIPVQQPGIGSAMRWYESFYVKELPLAAGNGWKVVVESSVRPQLEEINRQTSLSLGIVAFLIVAIISLSRLFAVRYSSVLQRLEDATRQLPVRISSGEVVGWPTPMTSEMAGLIVNFQAMGTAIQQHVTELESLNESLEQRVAERTRALDELNRDFVSFLENTTDFVYFKDENSRFRFCSQTLATITGYASWRDMIGKHDLEVFPEDTARIYYEEELPVFRDGTPLLNKTDPFYDARGMRGWVNTNKWPVFDSENRVVGIFGISRDITEQKQMLEALRESEEKHRILFDYAGDVIFIHDDAARMLAVNPLACERLGYTRAELMSMTVNQVVSPEQGQHVPDRIARLMEHGSLVFETVHRRKDGSLVPTEVSARKINWRGQAAMMSICRDITQRKQIEEALQEANQFSEQVIRSAQEGVIVYDLDLRYRVWNPYMEELSGMTAGEVLGRHPTELFPFLQTAGLIDHLEKVLSGEAQGVTDIPYSIPKTGKSGWASDVSSPLRNTRGEIIGVIATVRENTWRKRMEDELRQALEAARSANGTMNRLLCAVAHEFRTPLGLLTGSTDILDRYWDRLSPEKRFEQNEHIRSAARQISNLINSVISFNQLGGSAGNPLRVLDIGEECHNIAAEVETVWASGHDFIVAIAADCGTALLDEMLFRRIVENLLTNAFRYTPSQGTVALHVRRETDRLLVEIIDSGIGIPEEDQQLIFDAFYRSRNVEGRRGLGLGLSMVHESLMQLGGTITVTSRIGEGTAMRVEIPVVDPARGQ